MAATLPPPDAFCNAFWGRGQAGVSVIQKSLLSTSQQTFSDLRALLNGRAEVEEQYAKGLQQLSTHALGSGETSAVSFPLSTFLGEIAKSAAVHAELAQTLRDEAEQQLRQAQDSSHRVWRNKWAALVRLKQRRASEEKAAHLAQRQYETDALQVEGYERQAANADGHDRLRILEKKLAAQNSLIQSRKAYAAAVRQAQDSAARWTREWKDFCDLMQDMEERRLDQLQGLLWDYANAVSGVCVSDDQGSEAVRQALETKTVEEEVLAFIQERGTGREMDPPLEFYEYPHTPPAHVEAPLADFARDHPDPEAEANSVLDHTPDLSTLCLSSPNLSSPGKDVKRQASTVSTASPLASPSVVAKPSSPGTPSTPATPIVTATPPLRPNKGHSSNRSPSGSSILPVTSPFSDVSKRIMRDVQVTSPHQSRSQNQNQSPSLHQDAVKAANSSPKPPSWPSSSSLPASGPAHDSPQLPAKQPTTTITDDPGHASLSPTKSPSKSTSQSPSRISSFRSSSKSVFSGKTSAGDYQDPIEAALKRLQDKQARTPRSPSRSTMPNAPSSPSRFGSEFMVPASPGPTFTSSPGPQPVAAMMRAPDSSACASPVAGAGAFSQAPVSHHATPGLEGGVTPFQAALPGERRNSFTPTAGSSNTASRSPVPTQAPEPGTPHTPAPTPAPFPASPTAGQGGFAGVGARGRSPSPVPYASSTLGGPGMPMDSPQGSNFSAFRPMSPSVPPASPALSARPISPATSRPKTPLGISLNKSGKVVEDDLADQYRRDHPESQRASPASQQQQQQQQQQQASNPAPPTQPHHHVWGASSHGQGAHSPMASASPSIPNAGSTPAGPQVFSGAYTTAAAGSAPAPALAPIAPAWPGGNASGMYTPTGTQHGPSQPGWETGTAMGSHWPPPQQGWPGAPGPGPGSGVSGNYRPTTPVGPPFQRPVTPQMPGAPLGAGGYSNYSYPRPGTPSFQSQAQPQPPAQALGQGPTHPHAVARPGSVASAYPGYTPAGIPGGPPSTPQPNVQGGHHGRQQVPGGGAYMPYPTAPNQGGGYAYPYPGPGPGQTSQTPTGGWGYYPAAPSGGYSGPFGSLGYAYGPPNGNGIGAVSTPVNNASGSAQAPPSPVPGPSTAPSGPGASTASAASALSAAPPAQSITSPTSSAQPAPAATFSPASGQPHPNLSTGASAFPPARATSPAPTQAPARGKGAYPSHLSSGKPVIHVVQAMYDYTAQLPEEFSFRADDLILVSDTPEDGWWEGELLDQSRRNPAEGEIFPSNFTTLVH